MAHVRTTAATTMENPHPKLVPSYSQIACIGTGISAIALGATLKRWYQLDDIRFFERNSDCGGTWHVNSYAGCACDVPSALYSFSFAPNPRWTKLMPSYQEIKAYQHEVADTYHLRKKMTFHTEVKECYWREDASRWLMVLRNVNTDEVTYHECQILFGATGVLVEPRPCDILGASTFKGSIFHSARWNHDVSLDGKKVVVIGNGCTAAQIVPAIADRTETLTQIIRSQHWVVESANFTYPPALLWIFRKIPFALKLHRLHIFLSAENTFRMFPMTKDGARFRENQRKEIEAYMRRAAPAKYHDILIPDFEVGCKRRIFDCGYLKSLHKENLLLTNANILEIVPDGIKTSDGFIPADVIILATGFQTNQFLPGIQVHGRNGTTVDEHWSRNAGPGAYNTSAMNGFPNFFLLLGPNSATGHTSAVMASENAVNYALRILKPVLEGKAVSVEVKQQAEDDYIAKMQSALQKTVWHTGCNSWYVNEKRWNGSMYPWSQGHFWYRSLFPIWSDWTIKWTKKPVTSQWKRVWLAFLLTVLAGIAARRYNLGGWEIGLLTLIRKKLGL